MRKNRTLLSPLSFFLATQIALVTPAGLAHAANPPAAQPSTQVQPVPYPQSQPVPYSKPSALVGATPASADKDSPPITVLGAVQPGTDVVFLKSGGMVRGTLIEILPNDHATMTLATGQNAIIQWDHIHHIERGVANAPAATRPAQPTPTPVEPTARVHIESEGPVTIERHLIGRNWQFACEAPCDSELPVSSEYRIVGAGMRTSASFHLAAQPGERIVLDVKSGSKGAFAGGVVMVSVGGAMVLIGLLVAAFGSAEDSTSVTYSNGSYTQDTHAGDAAERGGLIAAGIGAALLVGGIVLVAGSKTSVDQEPAQQRIGGDTWSRLPTWRDDTSATSAPKAFTTPLFAGSF